MGKVSIILDDPGDNPPDIDLSPEAAEIFHYIQNPEDETKQRLIKKYEPILADATAKIIDLINAAATDPEYKAAFSYNENQAYRQLAAKEITPDDFLMIPGKTEYDKLTAALDAAQLYKPLTYLQILKYYQKKPGKRVTGKMADAIAAQVKQIQKQTKAPAALLFEFTQSIAHGAMIELFHAYQHPAYIEIRKREYAAGMKQAAIIQSLKDANPGGQDANLLIYMNQEIFSETAKEMGDAWRLKSDLFYQTGIPQRMDQLISELHPGEKPEPIPAESTALDMFSPFHLPNTQAAKYTYMALNAPDRMASTKPQEVTRKRDPLTGAHSVNIKTPDIDLLFIFTGELSYITNGPKLFTFFLSKALAQHWPDDGIKFNLAELVDIGIYADKESAYRGLENSVTRMQDIDIGGTVTGYEGRKRKQIRNVGGALISWRDITFNQCIIKLPPIYKAGYIPFMPITDPNYYKLPAKAHMLYTYIMSCARQSSNAQKIKKQGYFTISLEAIRIYLGLPAIEEAGKDPKRLIVDPIEKALGDIMDSAGRDGLKIEIDKGNYNEEKARPPVSDYLNGYIRISLDKIANGIIEERAAERSKKIEQANKKKRQTTKKGD